MKKNMKFKSLIITLVVGMFLCLSISATAQDPPDPCTDPEIPCPIDGGLSLLIAAGIGIGAKKAYN